MYLVLFYNDIKAVFCLGCEWKNDMIFFLTLRSVFFFLNIQTFLTQWCYITFTCTLFTVCTVQIHTFSLPYGCKWDIFTMWSCVAVRLWACCICMRCWSPSSTASLMRRNTLSWTHARSTWTAQGKTHPGGAHCRPTSDDCHIWQVWMWGYRFCCVVHNAMW